MKTLYDKLKIISFKFGYEQDKYYKLTRVNNKILLKTKDPDEVVFKEIIFSKRIRRSPCYIYEGEFIYKFLEKNKDKLWADVWAKLFFKIKNHKRKININYKYFLHQIETPYYIHNGHNNFFVDENGYLRSKKDIIIS